MNASGSESVSSAMKQAEVSPVQASQQINNPGLGIETQLHSAADIASARSFFVSKVDMPAAPLSGIEHSGAAAMKAAEGAISPMLQLIMRLPGHLGLFSSFLEAFKNLFFSHDLLSNFNLGDIASGIDLTHATGLNHVTHLGHAIGALPSNLHALHHMSAEMVNSVGTANLHINPFDSLKQSMNVSSGIDLRNPQFEGVHPAANEIGGNIGRGSASGDSLAGPGLSAQTITPKLAPAERIFNSRSFESANNSYSNANNLLSFNSQTPTTSIASGATNSNLASLNQTPSNSNALSTNPAPTAENIAPHSSSSLSGLQAKALSLENVMHKGHSHVATDHLSPGNHFANNPFSKLASSTRQAFQSAQHVSPSTSFNHKPLANHYTVKQGDNLWQISKNIFGSGDKWTQLYKLNGSTIGANPGMIFSGQRLVLSGTINSIHPHLTPHHAEQLANHVAPPSATHNQSVVAHEQHSVTHNQTIVAHEQHVLTHNQNIVASEQRSITHNHQSIAHRTDNIGNQLKYQNPVADNRLAHAPLQHPAANGLKVEEAHDQLLSGAGGAQAATNTHSVTNKLSGLGSAKGKSVVSFSLAPDDLAQW